MPNILLADDHDLVRDTVAAYLESVESFNVQTAPDFNAAMRLMTGIDSIDLLILDYHMPGMGGLDGIKQTLRKFPATKVVLMSGVATRDVAEKAMESGAAGFIPKSLKATSLVNAIKFVLSGERYFPFEFGASETAVSHSGIFATLSAREIQTLEQLCIGLSNKEIARNLEIQEVTVKLHVKNLLSKLGVSNRTQAALLAKEKHFL